MRLVKNHRSFRSCLEVGDNVRDMFPNNAVVFNFELSKTKRAYLVTHGVTTWVKGILQVEVSNSPFYSVSSDGSLNVLLQENQIDIQVRGWSEKSKKVVTHY